MEDEQLLYRFSTVLISNYVNAIEPITEGSGPLVRIRRSAREEVDVLKEVVWAYVIRNPDLAVPQAGQRKAIRTVFRVLVEAARRNKTELFADKCSDFFLSSPRDGEKVRFVADYIASMTEKELVKNYHCLEGIPER
jgi:dGTP triphosphohydrolase